MNHYSTVTSAKKLNNLSFHMPRNCEEKSIFRIQMYIYLFFVQI